jgi:hypothetical protein
VLGEATGDSRLTRLTTARPRGQTPPSPIYYSLSLSTTPTSQCLFVPKLSWFWLPPPCELITLCLDLWLGWSLKQTCSSHRELSNGVSQFTYTRRGWVNSWLLMVGSQIANLTPILSFCHNLCYKSSNGSCEPIFNIYALIAFQWYREHPKARCFGPYDWTLKFQLGTLKKWGLPSPHFGSVSFILTLFQKWGCDNVHLFLPPDPCPPAELSWSYQLRWRTPNSLKDSNVSPNERQRKSEELGHVR